MKRLHSLKKLGFASLMLSSVVIMPVAEAGLSWFSRANCANNESISYDTWDPRILTTSSTHYRYGRYVHSGSIGWQNTWRSAVVHWREGFSGGWYVIGRHYLYHNGRIINLGTTTARGCNPGDW